MFAMYTCSTQEVSASSWCIQTTEFDDVISSAKLKAGMYLCCVSLFSPTRSVLDNERNLFAESNECETKVLTRD